MKLKIYYNGNSFDCYSIYYTPTKRLVLSENPTGPLGFSQFTTGEIGPHNGKQLDFKDLPEDIQAHIKWRLEL